MKDIERLLEERGLAPPSADLDGRMAELFAEAQTTPRPRVFARRVPLWLAAAACMLFAFTGYWFHGIESEPVPDPGTRTTIYVVHTDGNSPQGAFDMTADDYIVLGQPDRPQVRILDLEHGTLENSRNRSATNGGVS